MINVYIYERFLSVLLSLCEKTTQIEWFHRRGNLNAQLGHGWIIEIPAEIYDNQQAFSKVAFSWLAVALSANRNVILNNSC